MSNPSASPTGDPSLWVVIKMQDGRERAAALLEWLNSKGLDGEEATYVLAATQAYMISLVDVAPLSLRVEGLASV